MSTTFQTMRIAAVCAMLGAAVRLLYAVAFIVLRDPAQSALWLMLGGALSTIVLVALCHRVQGGDSMLAVWALLMTTAGALGATIHGGYDLANVLHPAATDVPNALSSVDPRGLLTFGASGVGLAALAWLMRRNGFSRALVRLSYLSAALSVLLYLGRLIVLDPANPFILRPALLQGFVVQPIWNVWVGIVLWRGAAAMAATPPESASG